jgi:hypothetical protein
LRIDNNVTELMELKSSFFCRGANDLRASLVGNRDNDCFVCFVCRWIFAEFVGVRGLLCDRDVRGGGLGAKKRHFVLG